jgi:MOSC domain-containing protein YiiM
MLNPQSPLAGLMTAPMRPGRVVWIGLRSARRAAMVAVVNAAFDPKIGLVGDRYLGRSGNRQVTLVAQEHLDAIGTYLGRAAVAPEDLRRNIVTAGVNLLALVDQPFQLGTAVLRGTGLCHPCSRMEELFGEGGYNAVRGHGGITARVLVAGVAQLGDALVRGTDLRLPADGADENRPNE